MKSSNLWWSSSASIALGLLSTAGAASANDLPLPDSTIAEGNLVPVLFAVSVNGVPGGEPVILLMSDIGALFASEALLREWRLQPWRPTLVHNDIPYYPLDGVPGLALEMVQATQTLVLTASPGLLHTTAVSSFVHDMGPMTPSATGGFLNYDLVVQASSRDTALSGLFEFGLFTPAGSTNATFVARLNDFDSGLTRLETNWTSKDAHAMRFLRLGDSISRGGLGGNPVRFAGIHLARDFTTQPGFITIPLPTIGGESEVPSVVDVYVNNVLAGTRELPPGPFTIENVPVLTGGGEVQLVVRDLLGRETFIRQRYYTARQLLRRGLDDYSLEAGFLRQNFGRSSFDYGSPMASATYRYGFTNAITGEVRGEVSPDVRMGGMGASVALGKIGVVNASTAISHSDRGTGARYELGFERRTPFISYGALAELIDDDFVTVGNIRSDWRPPRLTLQAFAGIPLDFGSFSLAYFRRDERERRDTEFVSASASIGLAHWGSLSLTARKSLSGSAADALLVSLTVPLGSRTSANVGGELGQDDRMRLALQRSVPASEGIGFRAAAQIGDFDRFDGRLTYQTNFGRYDVDFAVVNSQAGLRVGASGGIGFIGDAAFASRQLTQSFATVKVGDYAGVRVYADNQVVGLTNYAGLAIIPRLRPFEDNAVRIEIADLPMDVQIDASTQSVRPFDRSGLSLDFGVRPARGAVVALARQGGARVPSGASIQMEGSAEKFIVAPGGEAYLTGLGQTTRGVASWPSGRCAFDVHYPENGGLQPRLGPLACVEDQ